jgi:hypothetical protein
LLRVEAIPIFGFPGSQATAEIPKGEDADNTILVINDGKVSDPMKAEFGFHSAQRILDVSRKNTLDHDFF